MSGDWKLCQVEELGTNIGEAVGNSYLATGLLYSFPHNRPLQTYPVGVFHEPFLLRLSWSLWTTRTCTPDYGSFR